MNVNTLPLGGLAAVILEARRRNCGWPKAISMAAHASIDAATEGIIDAADAARTEGAIKAAAPALIITAKAAVAAGAPADTIADAVYEALRMVAVRHQCHPAERVDGAIAATASEVLAAITAAAE